MALSFSFFFKTSILVFPDSFIYFPGTPLLSTLSTLFLRLSSMRFLPIPQKTPSKPALRKLSTKDSLRNKKSMILGNCYYEFGLISLTFLFFLLLASFLLSFFRADASFIGDASKARPSYAMASNTKKYVSTGIYLTFCYFVFFH